MRQWAIYSTVSTVLGRMDGNHENKPCLKLSERSSKLIATVCSVLKRMAEVMEILDGVLWCYSRSGWGCKVQQRRTNGNRYRRKPRKTREIRFEVVYLSTAKQGENITDSKSRSPAGTYYYKGVIVHNFMLCLDSTQFCSSKPQDKPTTESIHHHSK